MTSDFLDRSFFERPFLDVARDLIGCSLMWDQCGGTIVELEAYAVEGDAACHTSSRPSAREFVARHPAGTAYVYLNYGMYWLLNVLVKGGGSDGILLLRALAPTHGIELMQKRRRRETLTHLCSGPGKLGVALALDKKDHGKPLAFGRDWQGAQSRGFLPPEPSAKTEVITDVRIGISQAVDLPWRFLLKESLHLSVRPRIPRTTAA